MTEFSGVSRTTLAERVYTDLRAAILSGQVVAGSELNQVGLARQFGVSRVPVREALRRLQAEHLVSVTNYHQFVVTPIDPGALVELIEIRTELEVLAVRRRIHDVEPEMIKELRGINARLRKKRDANEWFQGDIDFHHMLIGPGSESASMVRIVRERVHRYLQMVASTQPRRQQACDEHDRILDAFADKDLEATEEALREHIRHTRTVILGHLRIKGADDDNAMVNGPASPAK